MKPTLLFIAASALLLGPPLAQAETPISLLAPRDGAPPAPIPLSAGDAATPAPDDNGLGGGIVKAEPLPPPPPRVEGDAASTDTAGALTPSPATAPEAAPRLAGPTPLDTAAPLAAPPAAPLAAPLAARRVEAPIPLDTPAVPPPVATRPLAATPTPLTSPTTPAPLTASVTPTPLTAQMPKPGAGLPAWVPSPLGPEPKPFAAATPPDGKKQAKTRESAARQTDDQLPDDGAPGTYLRVARGALLAGRGTEARSALEMAQTRLLSRDVDSGQERFPSDNKAVRDISDAIAALAANDRASSLRLIENASLSIGAPLD